MSSDIYKKKVKEIINKAKDKGLVKTYSEFCETEDASILYVAEEEELYYTSLNEANQKKYKIGEVNETDLQRFVETYEKYLDEN